jgi:hypothetical protein
LSESHLPSKSEKQIPYLVMEGRKTLVPTDEKMLYEEDFMDIMNWTLHRPKTLNPSLLLDL